MVMGPDTNKSMNKNVSSVTLNKQTILILDNCTSSSLLNWEKGQSNWPFNKYYTKIIDVTPLLMGNAGT